MARFEVPEGWAVQAYRFALDPTPTQLRALASHTGAARFAHNHMLALVKAVTDQRSAERSYGIPEDQLTPAVGWSLPALRKGQFLTIVANPGPMGFPCRDTRRTRCRRVSNVDTLN